MNQGRIWCVVHPTVGLPLLLGSVTVISLVVHASVMSNTTWMSRYWQGGPKANKTAETAPLSPAAASLASTQQPGFVISVAPVAPAPGKAETSFVVTVAPNAAATTAAAAQAKPPPSARLAAAVPRSP